MSKRIDELTSTNKELLTQASDVKDRLRAVSEERAQLNVRLEEEVQAKTQLTATVAEVGLEQPGVCHSGWVYHIALPLFAGRNAHWSVSVITCISAGRSVD